MSQNTISKPGANPILAAACSFLWGFGNLYNGQMTKYAVVVLLMWVGLMICLLPGVFIWVLNIIDSYMTAQRLAAGETLPENEYSLSLLYSIARIVDSTATCSRS